MQQLTPIVIVYILHTSGNNRLESVALWSFQPQTPKKFPYRKCTNKHFIFFWSKSKHQLAQGQIKWPARSAGLAPLDFWLWGAWKNEGCSVHSNTPDELKERISAAVNIIMERQIQNVHENLLKRLILCIQRNSEHYPDKHCILCPQHTNVTLYIVVTFDIET